MSYLFTLAHFDQTILSMLLFSGNTLNGFNILLLSMTGTVLFSIRSTKKNIYISLHRYILKITQLIIKQTIFQIFFNTK